MPWFVYIARCADDTLYCGITNDLIGRLEAHNAGKGARYTRSRTPIAILVTRRCMTKGRALSLEYQVKQLTRAQKEALVVEWARRSASRSPRSGRGSTRSAARGRRAASPTVR